MKEWLNLTKDERAEARAGRGRYENKQRMDDCLAAVLAILKGNAGATAKAWKVAWGNYLINTPEEIATYCREAAKQ